MQPLSTVGKVVIGLFLATVIGVVSYASLVSDPSEGLLGQMGDINCTSDADCPDGHCGAGVCVEVVGAPVPPGQTCLEFCSDACYDTYDTCLSNNDCFAFPTSPACTACEDALYECQIGCEDECEEVDPCSSSSTTSNSPGSSTTSSSCLDEVGDYDYCCAVYGECSSSAGGAAHKPQTETQLAQLLAQNNNDACVPFYGVQCQIYCDNIWSTCEDYCNYEGDIDDPMSIDECKYTCGEENTACLDICNECQAGSSSSATNSSRVNSSSNSSSSSYSSDPCSSSSHGGGTTGGGTVGGGTTGGGINGGPGGAIGGGDTSGTAGGDTGGDTGGTTGGNTGGDTGGDFGGDIGGDTGGTDTGGDIGGDDAGDFGGDISSSSNTSQVSSKSIGESSQSFSTASTFSLSLPSSQGTFGGDTSGDVGGDTSGDGGDFGGENSSEKSSTPLHSSFSSSKSSFSFFFSESRRSTGTFGGDFGGDGSSEGSTRSIHTSVAGCTEAFDCDDGNFCSIDACSEESGTPECISIDFCPTESSASSEGNIGGDGGDFGGEGNSSSSSSTVTSSENESSDVSLTLSFPSTSFSSASFASQPQSSLSTTSFASASLTSFASVSFISSNQSNFSFSSSRSSSYRSSSFGRNGGAFGGTTGGIDPVCGDGIVEGGEACDAGGNNVVPGTIGGVCSCDPSRGNCNSSEQGLHWSACTWARCGDGAVNNKLNFRGTPVNYELINEQCDDGNTLDGDGCSANCKDERSQVASGGLCGDGLIHDGEQCDDGNRNAKDGCSANCMIEDGYCGDSIVQPELGEQCESTVHDPSQGFACSPNCRNVSFLCGNGVIDPGEECDEGKDNLNDPTALCRADCSAPRCGDGVLDPNEICDDGNRKPGDGCDNLCRQERRSAPVVAGQQNVPNGTNIPFGQNQVTGQLTPFPNFASTNALPYDLPYEYLQPYAQLQGQPGQGPAGDTGPAALAVMIGGAASGVAWARRKKRK